MIIHKPIRRREIYFYIVNIFTRDYFQLGSN